MYSYRLEQAIRAAAVLHRQQQRKGSVPLPYITHVFAAAFTIMDYTEDEDMVIATLLHDTLEDTDYTIEELQEDFGGRVRDLVETVSEPKSTLENPISWKDRKLQYLKKIKKGPEDALMIVAADKIHNFRTTVDDYFEDYNRYLQDFGKNFKDRIEIYQMIANVLNSRLKNPIVSEFNHVFTEYRNFIQDVQDSKNRF